MKKTLNIAITCQPVRLFLTFPFYILFFLSINLYAEQLSLSETITLDGDFIQGGIVIGQTTPGSQVIYDAKVIRVSPKGDFIIGFNRDEPRTVVLEIITKNNKK